MDWQPYIRASWELVLEGEGRAEIQLPRRLEAYLVHLLARSFRSTRIPPDIICLEFESARQQDDFLRIGDACLLVDAWDIRRARLVSSDYYEQMGQMAYQMAALRVRPTDRDCEVLARCFPQLSRVLRGVHPEAWARGRAIAESNMGDSTEGLDLSDVSPLLC